MISIQVLNDTESLSCFWLQMLPLELQPLPLEFLDLCSLDLCKQLNSAFMKNVSKCSNWKRTYEKLWPEDIAEGSLSPSSHLTSLHDYRSLFLNKIYPRIDGVFVGTCRYNRRVQAGASLTDPRTSVIVEYFRVIRLLPDNSGYILRCPSMYEPCVVKIGTNSFTTQNFKPVRQQC